MEPDKKAPAVQWYFHNPSEKMLEANRNYKNSISDLNVLVRLQKKYDAWEKYDELEGEILSKISFYHEETEREILKYLQKKYGGNV